MSTGNGLVVGERVVMRTHGTARTEWPGVVAEPPAGRVTNAGCVWIRLDAPLLGRSLLHVPLERVQRPEGQPEVVAVPDTIAFAPLLREYRDLLRFSQSRLAEAAGFDHSYVSRLESGTRMPTRDAVAKLAGAMGLDDGERDALLASAGFLPSDVGNLFANEPVLSEVLGVLQDRGIPAEVREDVREMIRLCVRQAQRQAVSS